MGEIGDHFIGNRICPNPDELISMWGWLTLASVTMVSVVASTSPATNFERNAFSNGDQIVIGIIFSPARIEYRAPRRMPNAAPSNTIEVPTIVANAMDVVEITMLKLAQCPLRPFRCDSS